MAVITPFFDVVAGVAILAGRSSLLDTGIFKTANTNFTIRHLLALGFIGYGGWNLWKIERAQDKLKKSLGAEEEEKYLVTFQYTNGDMEEIDKVIFSKGDRYKYGDSEERNYAHLINSQYYMRQGEEVWEEWPDAIEYSLDWDYVEVEWGDGYARVRSIETISAEDVKVLAKWGFGAEDDGYWQDENKVQECVNLWREKEWANEDNDEAQTDYWSSLFSEKYEKLSASEKQECQDILGSMGAESFGAEPMFVQSDGIMVELMGFDGSYRSDGEVKVGYTTAAELGFEPKQLKPVMWVWDDIEGYGAFMATEDIRLV